MREALMLAVILLLILGTSIFLYYAYQLSAGKSLTSGNIDTLTLVSVVMLLVLTIIALWILFVIFSPN